MCNFIVNYLSSLFLTPPTCSFAGRNLVALINNAGMQQITPMEYVPLDAMKFAFDVNVFAPVALVQKFLPMLKKSGSARRIINIGK